MLSRFFKKKVQATTNEIQEIKGTKAPKTKISSNRIGELGEYKINIQLDQLPKESRYLSDVMILNSKAKSGYSQIDHVIFTPYTIFVVETKNYAGTIYGDRNRENWNVNGKFTFMNPFNQNFGHILAIKGALKEVDKQHYVSIVSFTKRCTFKVNEELRKIQSDDLIVYDTELSEYITRKLNILKLQNKVPIYSAEEVSNLYHSLQEANITDVELRKSHIEALQGKKQDNALATCKVCGTKVSEKIQQYCMANKTRFKGEVYCFEHQKQMK